VPWVTQTDEAERAPELAVLSALAHGQEPNGVDVAVAAIKATKGSEEERAGFYYDLVVAALNEAARRVLESLMKSVPDGYQPSEESKKFFEFMRKRDAEAEAKGKAEGKAEAVLSVLAARGIAVSDAERGRISSCSDGEMLQRWIERAVHATSVADVLS
jgi:hypothetical protein